MVLIPVLDLPYPVDALCGNVTGSVVVGFDSYSESHSVIQSTTLGLNEFRTRLNLGYVQGNLLNDYIQIEGRGLIGEESLETSGRINLVRGIGTSRVGLDNTVTFRSYRENTTYAFANDYLRYNLRAFVKREIAPGFSLAIADRLEIIDFDERTQFDYDYVRNGVELAATLDRGFTSDYQARVAYIRKSIPDSTEIGYDAYAAGLQYRHTFGVQRQVFITVDGERRIYTDDMTRSPFWSLYSSANFQPITFGSFGVTFDNVLESYQYDQSTAVFFDYVDNRSTLQISYFRSTLLSIAIGPTYGVLRSGMSQQDEYTEVGGKLSVDYNSGRRLWFSASYEPGRRNYNISGLGTTDSIFSDFVYHRVLLFAVLRLWNNASINAFANLEPEDHKAQNDDTTTTVFSTDISYSF